MRILLIMDPFIRVPPIYYGGIERIIDDLANVYAKRGHAVTLIAAPGSKSPGRLITFGREGEWNRWSNFRNFSKLSLILQREIRHHDLVHNFGRLAYLLSVVKKRIPKIQSYYRSVNESNIGMMHRLGSKNLLFTAISDFIRLGGSRGGGQWRTIYNCASVEKYTFCGRADPDTAPLVFLGRLERCKGIHSAIAVARRCNRKLIIAGNISHILKEKAYFYKEIEPLIDNQHICYIGPVDDMQKNEILGKAAAMLLPVEWDEPFPGVISESLLCGVPVIAFRRGGIPEGIDDGKTGFLCDTVDEMVQCVKRLPEIDRRNCRRIGERRFSAETIAFEYLRLYEEALNGRKI